MFFHQKTGKAESAQHWNTGLIHEATKITKRNNEVFRVSGLFVVIKVFAGGYS
jgi:hypothetical protein